MDARRDSPPSNIVKHRGEFCRILLVSHSPLHGAELLEGWSLQQNVGLASWFTAFSTRRWMDKVFCALISLLDRIRSGWFDLICLLPAAATWSRAPHFRNGQKPLWSRTEPFGLQSLDPNSASKVTASKPAAGVCIWVSQRGAHVPDKEGRASFWFFSRGPLVDGWSLVHPQSGDCRNSGPSKTITAVDVAQCTFAKLEILPT